MELAGTSWVVTKYDYRPSDTGITNPLGEEAVLVFGEDGTLTGHSGCNEFTGTWETTGPYYVDDGEKAFEDKVDGQPVTITADVATSVECEGWVAEQDVDVVGALVAAEIWYIGNILGDKEGGSHSTLRPGKCMPIPPERVRLSIKSLQRAAPVRSSIGSVERSDRDPDDFLAGLDGPFTEDLRQARR
ncbi:MAG TPA: META domain-containing protein [Acidimicrobiia bacterium]|nr:META domain-containing protein [Acidimicrobiia bacterium]